MAINRPHIHIVDDSKEDILLFQHFLEGQYEISFSLSGQECLTILNTMIPDVILLDVYMNGLDGYEVCKRIREYENSENIYIIFTTAATSRQEKLRGYEVGGDDYITKPIDPDELTAKLLAFQKHKKWVDNQVCGALDAAYDAMCDSNELAIIINFLHNSFSCYDFASLAQEFFIALGAYKVEAYFHVFTDDDILNFTSANFNIANKQEIISNNRHKGKIITEANYILINFNRICIILTNLPDKGNLRYQKIFDKSLMLIEGLQQRAAALVSRFILEKANEDLTDKTFQLEAQKAAAEHLLSELEKQKNNLLIKTEESLKARQEAEEATKAKSTFLSNMSHEIRTPMNAIIGFTDLAIECNNPNTTKAYLEKIQSSSKLLMGILNDILDVSKIESGMFSLEIIEYDLLEILDDIYQMFFQLNSPKKINIIMDWDKSIPKILCGDPLRLRQVINNLLNNAAKFTDEGTIKLYAEVKHKEEDSVELLFIVSDSGIGMNEVEMARLFKPFSQTDQSITRKYGGTGLGLSICKHLVNLMGGEIWVESVPQQGSSFYFTIKCQYLNASLVNRVSPPADINDNTDIDANMSEMRILLVEDNELNQELIEEILQKRGINVSVADNGKLAIETLSRENFDLVLMDIQMPVMDGIEATKLIRSNSKYQSLPIIATTANALAETRDKCIVVGFSDFITKPISVEKLLQLITKWTGKNIKGLHASDTKLVTDVETGVTDCSPICIKSGLEKIEGDEVLYNKIIFSFYDRYQGLVARMEEDFSSNNMDKILQTLHTLKGLAGTIGAGQLSHLAVCLEQEIKQKNDRETLKYYGLLKQQILAVLEQIVARREKFSGKNTYNDKQQPVSYEELRGLLESLEKQIRKHDFNALETFNKTISSVDSATDSNILKDLETNLMDFDFTRAKQNFNSFKEYIISSIQI